MVQIFNDVITHLINGTNMNTNLHYSLILFIMAIVLFHQV